MFRLLICLRHVDNFLLAKWSLQIGTTDSCDTVMAFLISRTLNLKYLKNIPWILSVVSNTMISVGCPRLSAPLVFYGHNYIRSQRYSAKTIFDNTLFGYNDLQQPIFISMKLMVQRPHIIQAYPCFEWYFLLVCLMRTSILPILLSAQIHVSMVVHKSILHILLSAQIHVLMFQWLSIIIVATCSKFDSRQLTHDYWSY